MEKWWTWKRAAWTLLLLLLFALVPACFDAGQNLAEDGQTLMMGLPFAFYSIRSTNAGTFAVHLNIAALAADGIVWYALLSVFQKLVRFSFKK